jgi:dUTP pyrophosphatase
MIPMNLPYIRVAPDAIPPRYNHEDDACFDLCAYQGVTIPPGGSAIVPTGLIFNIPSGKVMNLYIRSGIAAKTKLRLSNGVGKIDAGFRNVVCALIDNIGDKPATIEKNDRIVQAEIVNKVPVNLVEATVVEDTARGLNGLGSSGTNPLLSG